MGAINEFTAVMENEFRIISREPGGLALLVILPYFVAGGTAVIASFLASVNRYRFAEQFIGFEVVMLSIIMMQTGARFLREERNGGRLEYLLASPTNMFVILFGTSLVMASSIVAAFTVSLMPIAYGVYGIQGMMRALASIVLLLIGLMPLYGLGLALSGLVLRFRDSDSLMGLITSAASLLSGATYPIQALPLWLGFLVRVLPMHALDDALYYELIGYLNATHVAYLVLASAVYLSLGAYLYGRLQKSLLRKGIV
ncbi:ABC transporter [Thermocladium modestius]|uniref:ABC transporter n=1 Tax=Thermocladium modestius TaxID=62609 RepID=A0A830GS81_9CREN|nr:ABC transporter permease [Thermocladium modestius]GGP20017.1 ABC transporter [Thermocladium modestius]